VHPSLSRLDHRPWQIPGGPWVLRQRWTNLLFAHWPVKASALRSLVPPELTVQEFGGTSWVGVVPFQIESLTWRPLPNLPYFSFFPEINLRLYVEAAGKPGVWFISLDADNAAAVWGARAVFHLPYWRAAIDVHVDGRRIRYRSVRRTNPSVNFEAEYEPTAEGAVAAPGSLEHFLTERYCLYAKSSQGALRRLDIHHAPWMLQPATAQIHCNTLASGPGIHLDARQPALLHFSAEQDVVAWWPRRV
jgi:uncharacterized protein YqjF (DUF2071 family)